VHLERVRFSIVQEEKYGSDPKKMAAMADNLTKSREQVLEPSFRPSVNEEEWAKLSTSLKDDPEVCGLFQLFKGIHHSSFHRLLTNPFSDFPCIDSETSVSWFLWISKCAQS
jgi:hypothetical protein